MNAENSPFNLSRLFDVEMDVTVRFGLTQIPLREVVNFGNGSMIELNRTVDSPVELLVNNFPFAKGEVVVVDGYYSIKITEIDLPANASESPLKKNQDAEPTMPGQDQIPPDKPNQTAPTPNNVPPQPTNQQPATPAAPTTPPAAKPTPPKQEENK